ncbi:phospholipase D-like domain-containing protein [Chitinivorax tropicus]|uniref:phospholipase D-like domain-containing protein n=1 Tax=Chitinivorax tropicus TaxID=714531 RepID=UPI003CCCD110
MISQLVDGDGKAAGDSVSAPGWFPVDGPEGLPSPYVDRSGINIGWGKLFSRAKYGNKVNFFVTGEEYFSSVAKDIRSAKSSVFILGWQVNFDVELETGVTLLDCLDAAIKNGATVYVMPWLSPKAGLDTGDFETVLAVHHLNAGLAGGPRAFAMPAIQQSDMPTGLKIGFSHHQKLVVIDNERAYVGGIDLAYGRRDTASFNLKADWREGNELYNSCIPSIYELDNVDKAKYLTRMELLFSCFDSFAGDAGAWWFSSSSKPVAYVKDGVDMVERKVSEFKRVASDVIDEAWNNVNLLGDFIDDVSSKIQDKAVDISVDYIRGKWATLPPDIKRKIEKLALSGSANALNNGAAVIAWLNNASLDELPGDIGDKVGEIILTLVLEVVKRSGVAASKRKERYENLFKLKKILPKSGFVLNAELQPRMPWHDVHCQISGPSVIDLSRNFIKRWNGVAKKYEQARLSIGSDVQPFLDVLGINYNSPVKLPRVKSAHIPKKDAISSFSGKSWVQVLRSGPKTMLKDEEKEDSSDIHSNLCQNNCLKAMLRAISGSQNFIYIEGQFFQSWYGRDEGLYSSNFSGPMGALLDIKRIPGYQKYAKMLNLENVGLNDLFKQINWKKVDDVLREPGGREFFSELKAALSNLAMIEATKKLAIPQKTLLNPICQALVSRVRRAIADDLKFHIYLVLPVHPEGALNVLNIMTQVHLTQQSVVNGHYSLINGIRRAIYEEQLVRSGVPFGKAAQIAEKVGLVELSREVGEKWRDYVTLLNLRNWAMFEKRPVTEQIYVHSKLLIADDRVAILGSANINDRSMLGDRDSEIAVIVKDDEAIQVKLDGVHQVSVSNCVHQLRVRLWRKLFGLTGSKTPATELESGLAEPANPKTWQAIQKVAKDNQIAYENAFSHIPRHKPSQGIQSIDMGVDERLRKNAPASIWPVWSYSKLGNPEKGGRLKYLMPFHVAFWNRDEVSSKHYWEALERGPEFAPKGVRGFICALPITWTAGENNQSGMNLTMLADLNNGYIRRSDTQLADASASPRLPDPAAPTTIG